MFHTSAQRHLNIFEEKNNITKTKCSHNELYKKKRSPKLSKVS